MLAVIWEVILWNPREEQRTREKITRAMRCLENEFEKKKSKMEDRVG